MSGLAGYAFANPGGDPAARLHAVAERFTGNSHDVSVHVEADFGVVVAGRFEASEDLAAGSFAEIRELGSKVLAFEGYLVDRPRLDAAAEAECASRGEALLALFERHGDRLWPRLNGAFHLALWDRDAARLTLYVSKYGQRRLYRRQIGDGITFASEVKTLPLGGALEADPVGVSTALLHGLNYGTGTCFRGVRRLFQGTGLHASRGSKEMFRPSFVSLEPEKSNASAEELAEAFDELLRRSVARLAKVGGERPAVLLSSGADSALVAAALAGVVGPPLTVTQGLPGQDESEAAARIAEHFGAEHHRVIFDGGGEDLVAGVGELVELLEEPAWVQLGLPLLNLSRHAGDLSRSFFNGVAGDALFGSHGYGRFEERTGGPFDHLPRPYDADGVRLIVRVPASPAEDFLDEIREHLPRAPFDRFAYAQLMGLMSRYVISTGSSLAQRFGVEGLYPYLDDDVVLFSFTLADRHKLDGEETKPLLRRTLDHHLPRTMIPTGKTGYWSEVMRGAYELGRLEPTLELLDEKRTRERGIYLEKNLDKLIAKYRRREAEQGWHRILWQLLSFELFCRRFFDAAVDPGEGG